MQFPSRYREGLGLFATVFRHELRLLWRGGVTPFLFLTLALSMGLAIRTGGVQRDRQAAAIHRLAARDLEENRARGEQFAQAADSFSRPYVASLLVKQHATLPPAPLAGLDVGQSDLRPFSYPLHTDWHKVFFPPGPLRNEASLRTGHFDAGFLVVYLMPLLVVALCFSLLSADRESGALLLVLSQPVSIGVLLTAGLLARFLVVTVSLLLPTWGLMLLGFGGPVSPEMLLRLGLWSVVTLAYLSFWFALSALVVSTSGRASGNAILLVMAWVLLVLAVPGTVALTANARHPVPPRSDIMREVNVTRDEAFEHWRENETSFRVFYRDFPELLPDGARITPEKILDPLTSDRDFQSRVMIVIAYAVEQVALRLSRPHEEALRQRFVFIQGARLLSPVISAREGLMDVAGSGDGRYQEFNRQVGSFWSDWRYAWNKRIFRGPALTLEEFRHRPEFQFQEERLEAVLSRTLPGLATTCLAIILLAAVTAVLVRGRQSPLPAH